MGRERGPPAHSVARTRVHFPDGIAFAPEADKVFVSDEAGDADVVIDARTNAKRSTIALGGEAGNTHYDSVSHCILVAVQTRNQLVAIDPRSEKVVARYELPGSDHPHGFTIDEPGRLAFISSEESAKLQVLDLRTVKVIATHSCGCRAGCSRLGSGMAAPLRGLRGRCRQHVRGGWQHTACARRVSGSARTHGLGRPDHAPSLSTARKRDRASGAASDGTWSCASAVGR